MTASTPAAAAPRPGATGLHTGMMPAGSPDAPSASARPNGTLGGQAVAAAVPGAQTGVDTSHYQHPGGAAIDWNQVAASGQTYAFMKATELYTDNNGNPVLKVDPYLKSDMAAARAAGLATGAYAFAHPENSAIAQADDFADAIGGSLGWTLPPVLDLETDGGLTPAQLASWAHTFLDRLQADTGVLPMIYTGPGFWSQSMAGNTTFGHYPLWEAHYTSNAAPYAIAGWNTYSFWQYSSAGSVPGISGNVDVDRTNGPLSNFLAKRIVRIPQAAVSAVHTNAGSVLAFVRGTDKALYVTTAVNGVFGGYQRIPAGATSGPAAVSSDGSRVDVFVKGNDQALWHMSLTVDSQGRPATFGAWQWLGGAISTAPAAASNASGRLLVTAGGTDGSLWSRTFDGSTWQPWTYDGGYTAGAPALDVVDANTYRAQVLNADGGVWTNQISAATGAPLTQFQPSGVTSVLAPGASATASWATNVKASAYGVSGGAVQQRWANGTVVNLGGVVTSGLSLAEIGTSTVWTLARGSDNALWLNVTDGSTSTWSWIGGTLI